MWNRYLVLGSVLFLCGTSHAQVGGRVVELGTDTPLPYSTVAIKGTGLGTMANEEGVFRIAADIRSDTLLFSYVGYRSAMIPAAQCASTSVIRLERLAVQLDQVEVFNDDQSLFDLFHAASKKLARSSKQEARVLLEVNSDVDGHPVEVIGAYYNGSFEGPALKELRLKNGRIGLAPVEGRYFVNLSTTRAFAMLDIREGSMHHPGTPFSLGRRQLRRAFDLKIVGMHNNGTSIYHIAFAPRAGHDGFAGELWVDGEARRIDRITLHCKACATHPFRPLFEGPTIATVDLDLAIHFQQHAGEDLLDHMEMNYDLLYLLEDGSSRAVSTRAVLHPFNRERLFFEPILDYPPDQPDHRQITFLPYDSVFWDQNQGLVRTEAQEEALKYFAKHGILLGHDNLSVFDGGGRFFEDNYILWSATARIGRSALVMEEPGPVQHPATLTRDAIEARSTKVDLRVQLFLDATDTPAGLRCRSVALLDVFNSRYALPPEPWTNAFLNIRFDLCELERRRLNEKLQAAALTEERIRALHKEALASMKTLTERYERETGMGRDQVALQRWNRLVLDELGIDNLALFPLEKTP